jgi:hypothetical protein
MISSKKHYFTFCSLAFTLLDIHTSSPLRPNDEGMRSEKPDSRRSGWRDAYVIIFMRLRKGIYLLPLYHFLFHDRCWYLVCYRKMLV